MTNYRSLRNNKGMTLVEIMMAVAVLGVALLFVINMTNTSSRVLAGNSDQVRMMELARAQAETILAGVPFTSPTNKEIKYPFGSGSSSDPAEKVYAIQYNTDSAGCDVIGGTILTVTVGSVSNNVSTPLDIENHNNCTLVTWIPPLLTQ